MDGEDGELTMGTRDVFQRLCKDTWDRVNSQCCHNNLVDHTEEWRFDRSCRERHSKAIGVQLAMQKSEHEARAKAVHAGSHVDG